MGFVISLPIWGEERFSAENHLDIYLQTIQYKQIIKYKTIQFVDHTFAYHLFAYYTVQADRQQAADKHTQSCQVPWPDYIMRPTGWIFLVLLVDLSLFLSLLMNSLLSVKHGSHQLKLDKKSQLFAIYLQ